LTGLISLRLINWIDKILFNINGKNPENPWPRTGMQ
jgi:hypothetical protein